jgi:two-component system NtrC family response regulator
MRDALALARDVAASDLSVLIQGETGVGKEVLARWIHDLSARCKGPFIAINCAAIPRDLLESVLFGHKRGAFTGATTDQAGKFLAANGGTLFLDEIGELPQALQAKILRAVQEKTIEPLGSNRSMRVDVRFISATHRDLPTLIRSGSFREDLFYRLAEVALTVPALRTRMADVPLLATSFLREFAPEKSFTPAAWIWLKTRDWPGNVRELRSTLKRVSLLTRTQEVDVSDLVRGLPDQDLQRDQAAGPMSANWLDGETLDDARNRFTARKVREALLRSGGHRAKAAELLAITPRTLFRYLEEHAALIGDVTDLSSRSDKAVSQRLGPDA